MSHFPLINLILFLFIQITTSSKYLLLLLLLFNIDRISEIIKITHILIIITTTMF